MLLIKTVIKIYIWFVFFRKWLIYKLEQQFLSQSFNENTETCRTNY